jgi:hypothetical protein
MANPEVQSDLMKFGIAMILLALSTVAMYRAFFDPEGLTSGYYMYMVFIVLPVIAGIFVLNPVFQNPLTLSSLLYALGVIFLLFFAIYMFYYRITPTSVWLATDLLKVVFALGALVGLAIVYRLFFRSIVNMKGVSGFVLRVIFLLPCLIVELAEKLVSYVMSVSASASSGNSKTLNALKASAEAKTPAVVFVLLALEVIIIFSYFYLVPIFKYKIKSDEIVLLDKPASLSELSTAASADNIFKPADGSLTPDFSKPSGKMNYTISMWLYIEQQPNSYSAKYETNIFRYGNKASPMGYPRITYKNDPTRSENCLVYTYENQGETPPVVPIELPLQQWNNVVLCYGDSSVDVFVNGDLVNSGPRFAVDNKNSTVVVEIGYGDKSKSIVGVYGEICHISFYKRPLSAFEIAAEYNTVRYKQPPTHA